MIPYKVTDLPLHVCDKLPNTQDIFLIQGPICPYCKEVLDKPTKPSEPTGGKSMGNPFFHALLTKCGTIHDKKSHDYASEGDPNSNFKRAAMIASWFDDEQDKIYATLIGIKLARLAELRNGKSPKNESIEDTFVDQANYTLLWGARVMEENQQVELVGYKSGRSTEQRYRDAVYNEPDICK